MEAVHQVRSRLSYRVLVGSVAQGQAELGCVTLKPREKRWELVKGEKRAGVEELHASQMVVL